MAISDAERNYALFKVILDAPTLLFVLGVSAQLVRRFFRRQGGRFSALRVASLCCCFSFFVWPAYNCGAGLYVLLANQLYWGLLAAIGHPLASAIFVVVPLFHLMCVFG